MSIFSSQSTWTGACSGANQSPINLSQSIAKPCNLSCELVFDEGLVSTSEVLITDEGLVLTGNLGSCKFRGESYVCIALTINHPSHHTIEGIQADGEVIAIFQKPTGERLHISSLFRVNQAETASLSFFKQVVPYAQPSAQATKLMLNNWSISQMVPPAGSYFVYDGSTVVPGCQSTEWVVFKAMINIDPTDFAFLVKNVQPGSRSVQALGNREIFFNSNESLPGGPMPHDNKTYMRCRPSGKKAKSVPVQKVDLKTTEAKERDKKPDPNSVGGMYAEHRKTSTFYDDFLLVFMALCVIGGLYFGYSSFSPSSNIYTYIRSKGAYVGDFVKSIFRKKEVVTNIPS